MLCSRAHTGMCSCSADAWYMFRILKLCYAVSRLCTQSWECVPLLHNLKNGTHFQDSKIVLWNLKIAHDSNLYRRYTCTQYTQGLYGKSGNFRFDFVINHSFNNMMVPSSLTFWSIERANTHSLISSRFCSCEKHWEWLYDGAVPMLNTHDMTVVLWMPNSANVNGCVSLF